ncbi:hypothetical protein PGQ11_015196 [Apiospora arundinis]|uniref:Uncharacterized protein n=1 Tax=Apiospora arundinis TaxID=335852 RepID=A0ABR2HKQ0_9PEZI
MPGDKKSQQPSVEEIESRFEKLSIKIEQANAHAQKPSTQKGQRGTGIFRKPAREISEANFLEELDRLDAHVMANKAKKHAQTAAATEKMLSELEAKWDLK